MEQNWKVLIVGHNNVLDQLLAMAIREELQLECEINPEIDPGAADAPDTSDRTALLLVDDSDQTARSGLLHLLRDRGFLQQHRVIAALFNIDPARSGSGQAVRSGVTGLFFRSNGLDDVLHGVASLLRGEVWIPRDVLVNAATEADRHGRGAVEQSGLTMREMEILNLVSTGATNDQIAARLCISPHTVKTHLYNIFRKIGVDNRFRAALWVTQNMGTRLPSFDPGGLAVASGQ